MSPAETNEPDDVTLVRSVAALAGLSIDADEAHRMGPEFARILDAFGTLAELSLDESSASSSAESESAVVRPDEPRGALECAANEGLLELAPERVNDFYGVPKTVGGDA